MIPPRWMVIYNLLLCLVLIPAFPFLAVNWLTKVKRRRSLAPRMGLGRIWQQSTPHAPVWVHALSVGEMQAAGPLLGALRARWPDMAIVLSASTHSGYRTALAQHRKVADAIVYYPYDLAWVVQRAIDRIAPRLFVLVESDIWPNFLATLAKRKIPALLVNARLSRRSLAGFKRFDFFSLPMFAGFYRLCCQSKMDADRFQTLGIPSTQVLACGNLKFDREIIAPAGPLRQQWQQSLRKDPRQWLIVAGSTHPGEEKQLLEIFPALQDRLGPVRLVIVPRDPERARPLARLIRTRGFQCQRVSDHAMLNNAEGAGGDIVVVGLFGVLTTLYALADIAFVGGSLVNEGGHNPLEPAALGVPVLFGPHMEDFVEAARLLTEGGAALQVSDPHHMADAVVRLCLDDAALKKMGRMGRTVVARHRGATANIIQVIEQIMGGDG